MRRVIIEVDDIYPPVLPLEIEAMLKVLGRFLEDGTYDFSLTIGPLAIKAEGWCIKTKATPAAS